MTATAERAGYPRAFGGGIADGEHSVFHRLRCFRQLGLAVLGAICTTLLARVVKTASPAGMGGPSRSSVSRQERVTHTHKTI